MKKIINTLALLSAALTVSSCSGAAVEDLIQPPRLNEQYSEIYDALKAGVNGDINLKYPKSGQYRSAFVVTDMDGEPSDEAFVFYELPNLSDGSSLRINFLDSSGGVWRSVYDFAISGTEVESVFFDSFGDSEKYIVVSCLTANSSEKNVSVLTFGGGSPKEIYNARCRYFCTADTDGDGNNELFLAGKLKSQDVSQAAILGTRNGTFGEIGNVELSDDGSTKDYRSVIVGRIEDKSRAIFADYILSDGSYGTDVILCGNDRFIKPVYVNPLTTARTVNTFTPILLSRDTDGDGITEIPSMKPFCGYEETAPSQQVFITSWNSVLPDGTIAEKAQTFIGTKGDYMIKLPENWKNRVTVSISFTEGSAEFYAYNRTAGTQGGRILKIYSVSEDNRQKFENSGFIYLGTSDISGYSCYAELSDGDSRCPAADELREMFVIFKEE